MSGRPTHRLMIVLKDNTKHKTVAGSVWLTEEGFGSFKLNPGIILREQDSDRYYFNIVETDQELKPRKEPLALQEEEPEGYFG